MTGGEIDVGLGLDVVMTGGGGWVPDVGESVVGDIVKGGCVGALVAPIQLE